MANPSPTPQPPEEPSKKSGFQDKFKNSLESLRSNEKLGDIVNYATANTRDTISYVILIIGIVMLFFQPLYGGTLIGIIAGFYFSSEAIALFQNLNALIDEQGIVKCLIGGGLLVGLFICAPAIFVGFLVAVAIRQILFPDIPKGAKK